MDWRARLAAVGVLASLATAFAQGGRMSPAADSVNKFFCAFYAKSAPAGTNTFLSPASIWTALAMTSAGARGSTERQMREVLCLPSDDIHREAGRLLSDLNARGRGGKYELSVANSLWPQKGFPFLPQFVSFLKEVYSASLQEVDYRNDAEGARRQINTWVERETHDRIKEIVPQGALTRMTRLVLANAIYFKGMWQEQFKKEDTKEESFYLANGTRVVCKMMNRKGTVGYLKGDGFCAAELNYAGNDLSLVIFLPNNRDGLPEFERRLTAENLAAWTRGLRRQEVVLAIPKFTMTTSFDLGGVLAEMGMKDAFDPGSADFSGMNGGRDLFISKVLHKAFVEVNEEGTEAAAATTVVISLTSAPAEPVVFRADHPFFFLIRDRSSGMVLFAGRVVRPE